MSAYEKIVDPTLPHQLRLLYGTGITLWATCNCEGWGLGFRPEAPEALGAVKAGYAGHVADVGA